MPETALRVSFELSARDVRYFRTQLKIARDNRDPEDDDTVIQSALEVVTDAEATDPPEFVLVRLKKLEQLVEMMTDQDWNLEGRDRVRVLDALAYFSKPDDLIHDQIPGIGYLDDAIMVELITRELDHELKAYEDFCEFRRREGKGGDISKLQSRRNSLQSRMRRRRRRDRDKSRSRPEKRNLRLW